MRRHSGCEHIAYQFKLVLKRTITQFGSEGIRIQVLPASEVAYLSRPYTTPLHYCQWLLAYCYSQLPGTIRLIKQTALVSTWIDGCISMPISGDSPSVEILNRGPWCCSCGDSMNFLIGLIWSKFLFFLLTPSSSSFCY